MDTKAQALAAIEALREKIAAVDEEIMHDVVGVAQALGELRKALDEVDGCIAGWQFEKAANAGYGSVSSGFVFLQRTLGGLQERCMDKSRIVQDLAATLNCSYEEAVPYVDAVMDSSRPRG